MMIRPCFVIEEERFLVLPTIQLTREELGLWSLVLIWGSWGAGLAIDMGGHA